MSYLLTVDGLDWSAKRFNAWEDAIDDIFKCIRQHHLRITDVHGYQRSTVFQCANGVKFVVRRLSRGDW